jgi:hypothetical protein
MIDNSLPELYLIKHATLHGGDRTLRRRFERGEVVRVRSGVYLDRDVWTLLDADARYRVRVAATATATQHGTQFSHDSAAAMLRLPSLGAWSPDIHILSPRTPHGRSRAGLRRHSLGVDVSPVQLNDFLVTSLARTVIDISCTTTFARAVGMADDALRPPQAGEFRHGKHLDAVTPQQLRAELDSLAPYYGSVRATRVLDFASGKSGSLGESVSRVNIHLLGFPPPLLQVPFSDANGFIGFADFYWPELDAIGEFDGDVKYRDKRYLRGRLPEDVVIAEKHREDRMRAVVRAFTRWDWSVATDRMRLAERLRPLGLVRTR